MHVVAGSHRRVRITGNIRRRSACGIGRISRISGTARSARGFMEAVFSALRFPAFSADARQRGDMRGLRSGFDERGQVAFRLGLRVLLDCLATPDHEHDSPSSPVLAHSDRGQDSDNREDINADMTVTQIVDHADDRVDDGVRDQRDDEVLPQ